MINWSTLFHEVYAEPGAQHDTLKILVAEVGRPLPSTYLSLLAWSNGGEFRTGARWFQFFPALDPIHGVLAMTEAYEIPRYMPGALAFALNGGGTFYLFDTRGHPDRDEYPIVCARAGNLGWESDECAVVAESFEVACRGTANVDELLSKP